MTETKDREDLAKLGIGAAARKQRVSRALLARMLTEGQDAEDEDEGEGGLGSEEGSDEDRRFARLLIGSRLLRKRRIRKLMLAHLLRERSQADEEGDEGEEGEEGSSGEEGGSGEHEIARLLIASGILRRRRVRRAIFAHLLRERSDADEEGEEGFGEEEEAGSGDHKLARLLIGSRILRRRRVRRAVLGHLLRERNEAEDEGGESEEGFGDEEEAASGDHKLARLLIASRILRRRRVRRAVLAHLLRERSEGEDEGGDSEEGFGGEEEAGSGDHKLARLLIASRVLRRRHVRKAVLAHLLQEKREEAEA